MPKETQLALPKRRGKKKKRNSSWRDIIFNGCNANFRREQPKTPCTLSSAKSFQYFFGPFFYPRACSGPTAFTDFLTTLPYRLLLCRKSHKFWFAFPVARRAQFFDHLPRTASLSQHPQGPSKHKDILCFAKIVKPGHFII